ncbi:MAG: hypothetical protein HY870_24090 [Chloroflexi bacterium]|nr:hypothetical protein [Chloroflexota bacterium]
MWWALFISSEKLAYNVIRTVPLENAMKPTIENQAPGVSQSAILLRCFGYLRPHWKFVTGVYLTMVLIDLIAMVNPQLIRWTIDRGIGTADGSLPSSICSRWWGSACWPISAVTCSIIFRNCR